MTVTQMIYFREVCDRGGVTAAARATHVSQPTITNAIRDLEREFSVSLFSRQNKKMLLTDEGRFFYAHIAELVEQIESLENQMKTLGERNKKLTIGVPPMIGTFLFPEMFSQFHKSHGDIAMDMPECGSVQMLEWMEDSRMDLAIVIYDDGGSSKRFASVPLLQTQLVYCVAKNDPMADRDSVRIQELAGRPLVLMKQGSYQDRELMHRFQQAGVQPNILLRTEQLYTIEEYIQRQEAGGFLFRELAERNPALAAVALEPEIPISIHLIWDKNKRLSNAASEFIRFVKQYITENQDSHDHNTTAPDFCKI